MTVRQLRKEELDELKQAYLIEKAEQVKESASWFDLASASEIPDETIFSHYDGIDFVEEDFFCNAG